MTKLRKALLAGAVLALATPASAQPTPVSSEADVDLRCAAWAAIVAGLNQDNREVVNAFSMALTWFAARYEGATGTPFEQAMTADYLNGLVPQLEAIEQVCQPRMQQMGTRFNDWGTKLQEAAQ